MSDTTWTPELPLRHDATLREWCKRLGNCVQAQSTKAYDAARELAEAVAAQRVAEREAEIRDRAFEDAVARLAAEASKAARDLGSWLADHTDDDQWPIAEGMLNAVVAETRQAEAQLAAVTAERDVLKREVVRQRVLLACPHEFNVVPPTDLHPRQFSAYRSNYVRGWMGKLFSTGYGQRSMKQVAARGHDDGCKDFLVAYARALAAEEGRSDG